MRSKKGRSKDASGKKEVDPLKGFLPAIAEWFTRDIGTPSPPQRLGWPSIRKRKHTLILSPTGSGKTLAAFLWCLNELYKMPVETGSSSGVKVLYVSPLKALANDIDRNLRKPLQGIARCAWRQGSDLRKLKVAVRSGDTSSSERQLLLKKPPDILITTPESFYLMLTSKKAREILRTVQYVIVDEIHAMAGNKRGTHLSLTLERLDELVGSRSPVRIGLSATGRPAKGLARFLGGYRISRGTFAPRPVTIVEAETPRATELEVICPCTELGKLQGASVWPDVVRDLVEVLRDNRSILVFVSQRRQAERLAAQINEEAEEDLAYAHHGSLSAAVRREVEERFKKGEITCLVATASLELGIDIGSVDMVCQVQSPRTVTAGMQRVGRSGHRLGGTARARFYITHRGELAEMAVTARKIKEEAIEPIRISRCPLDVLAQQVVAMVAADDWHEKDLYRIVRRAYPYRKLKVKEFEAVLSLVSGAWNSAMSFRSKPRISWDRVSKTLRALKGTRPVALQGGGTIPDSGQFPVYLAGTKLRVGELEEEFVLETRIGDTFRLGSTTWTVERLGAEIVEVKPAGYPTARLPFWKGGFFSRGIETALECGALFKEIEEADNPHKSVRLLIQRYPIDKATAENLVTYVTDQKEAVGCVPHDSRILLETFPEPEGGLRLVIHALFGKAVTFPWALALEGALVKAGFPKGRHIAMDDGIMFRFESGEAPPLSMLPSLVQPETLESLLLEGLSQTAMFMTTFRNAAVRSLILPRMQGGRKRPVWLMRIKARDLLDIVSGIDGFPVIVEAVREILEEYIDLESLKKILIAIEKGEIETARVDSTSPSPFAAPYMFPFEQAFYYEGELPSAEAHLAAAAIDPLMLFPDTPKTESIEPEVVEAFEERIKGTKGSRLPDDEAEIFEHLRAFGDRKEEELVSIGGKASLKSLHNLLKKGSVFKVNTAKGRG